MSVLVKKQVTIQKGFPLGVVLSRKEIRGDVGIEVEVEGKKLPDQDFNFAFWKYHVDHSLRGEESAEYVLRNPVKFEKVQDALDELWNGFTTCKSRIDESNRTSVHVHLNVQQFHLNRLTSFMALYFCFEEILTEWCGDHRVGNLFCLRAKDAPAIISQIRRFIRSDGKVELRDNLHYSGLNANALHKFGSLEIRSLRGVASKEVVADWVSILQRLYTLSEDFPDPREICQDFSNEGPVGYFNKIMGDKASLLRDAVKWDDSKIAESMFEGIRMAQDLCYCRDWSIFKEVNIKNDPFGRSMKGIAQKVANMTVYDTQAAWGPAPPLGAAAPLASPFFFQAGSPLFIPDPADDEEEEEEDPEPDYDEEPEDDF